MKKQTRYTIQLEDGFKIIFATSEKEAEEKYLLDFPDALILDVTPLDKK